MENRKSKRIYTMGGKFDTRNFTVRDLIDLRGQVKLCQVLVGSIEEAAAAEAAGIDMVICSASKPVADFRKALPNTFMTVALSAHLCPSLDEAVRRAYEIMNLGADAIMCSSWNKKRIEALAEFGFPLMGHAGMVPRHSTWTGGLKAVGKTLEQAQRVFREVKQLEDAGAFAVEIELIPEKLLREITSRTSMLTISIGSGGAADVQFLFAEDILGENVTPPRHAKVYRNFYEIRRQMQAERIAAFEEFKKDVAAGDYPQDEHIVAMGDEPFNRFIDFLEN